MRKLWSIIMLLNVIGINQLVSQEYPIDLEKAYQYFMETKGLSDKDSGKLWGVKLYGSMMLVDPKTRFVVTNEADSLGLLEHKGNVFIGYLKPEDGIANTATRWAGKLWMMIMWNSLSEDKLRRTSLMMHELYHCIQDKIGLKIQWDKNGHLDEMQARIFMKMEWNALELAVFSKGKTRKRAINDALSFRNYRQKLFPGSKENECKLEMNEGLAEYTGFKLSHLKAEEQLNYFKTITQNRKEVNSYVRSFAYVSGPLYGYLLDEVSDAWRKKLIPDSDFGELLKDCYKIELEDINQKSIEQLAGLYDYETVLDFESRREENRLVRIQSLKEKLINNLVLKIELKEMGIQFDPRDLLPLKNYGTVYHTIRVTDEWGILDVSEDALLSDDWKTITVSATKFKINNNFIEGNGWNLKLNEGWRIKDEDGYKTLVK
ncbi:MAG: hypothetical protein CVU00_02970 [Bacteroidetes bacterium HGW-Bacteroidetes-17]|jgi:hypothetical protein|nr:MAG: hypothetical protein CVU00_02970 [Bacteroidetes bacterium HGW-Bacteroidetes-17]